MCLFAAVPEHAQAQDIDPYGGVDEFMKGNKDSTKSSKTEKTEKTEKITKKRKAQVRDLPSGESALPIMKAICPGHAELVDGEDGSIPACTKCPKEAETQAPQLRVARIVQIGEEHAVASTLGCSAGFNFRDSTVVLEKEDSGWKMLSYTPQSNTEHCNWLPVTPPTAICSHTTAGQGSAEVSYYSLTFNNGQLENTSLLSITDHRGACRFEGNFYTNVDDTIFEDINGDGEMELGLLITKKSGTKTGKKRPDDIPDGCEDVEHGVVKVKESREAHFFRIDGGKFKPVKIKTTDVENSKVQRYVE